MKKQMRKKRKKEKMETKKGFSLAEVMLSVFILSVGLVASIALMAQNIRHSIDSRNNIIASQLAQEGVEMVHNKRDANVANSEVPVSSEDAFADINGGTYCPEMDSSGTTFEIKMNTCNGSLSKKLYLGSSGYSYDSSGEETQYSRRVEVEETSSSERTVESMVVWGDADFSDDIDDCTISNKCAVVRVTLNDSGWR